MLGLYWLLAAAVFPAANAFMFWGATSRLPHGGPLPLIVSGIAVLAEVYVLSRIGSSSSWTARVLATVVISALTVVGIVVLFIVSLVGADCPPNAYECPL
jgi:hypothetical protein